MRVFLLFILLLSLAPDAVAAEPPGLEAVVRTRNPELLALDARLAEARSRVRPAGTWADPQVSLELMDLASLGGPRASVMQMVPLRGQPALMVRMAELDVAMLEQEREDRARMLVAEARQAEVELGYVRAAEAILQRSRDLVDRMARVSEAKYAVGKGMQPDVLRSHVAKTRLLAPLIMLEGRRQTAQATLMAIAPGYAAPATQPPAGLLAALPGLTARLEARHPMLAMRRLAIAHAEVGLDLAERKRVPDLGVGLVAGRQMPSDMPYAGVMVSSGLPVFLKDKQEQRVEAARSALEASRAALEAARRRLVGQLAASHAMAAAADRQLALYRGGLLAQARQTFKASLAAYQVDQGDFLMVLDAQMALNDVEMAEAMALAERLKADAMIEALAGPEERE